MWPCPLWQCSLRQCLLRQCLLRQCAGPRPRPTRAQEAAMGSSRVGFVGAGRMGFPMVERLAAAGHDLVVYARRAEAAADLTRLGVRHTTELAQAAGGADGLLLCVFIDGHLARNA